jgi:hypothetical protein
VCIVTLGKHKETKQPEKVITPPAESPPKKKEKGKNGVGTALTSWAKGFLHFSALT